MLDESNGRTLLDDSDIYIDDAGNFVSGDNCVLFAFGKVGGLGAVAPASLRNSTPIAAVEAGHGYVAVRSAAAEVVPLAERWPCPLDASGANYLKIYVVSSLTAESKTVKGAVVKFVTAQPQRHGLPEWGDTVLTIENYDHLGQEVVLTLPTEDFEFVLDDNGYDIRCEQRGGKLYIRLGGWFAPRFELYLRSRESYTMVYVDVDVSL
ncbi:MAG: DUF5036 family protein [Alistipes senegalensis]